MNEEEAVMAMTFQEIATPAMVVRCLKCSALVNVGSEHHHLSWHSRLEESRG